MTIKFQKTTSRTDVIVVDGDVEANLKRIGYALGEMEVQPVSIKLVPERDNSYFIQRRAKEGIQTDLITFSNQNKVAVLLRWAQKWERHPALDIAAKQAGTGNDPLPKHAVFVAEKTGMDIVVVTNKPEAAALVIRVAQAWAATGYPKNEDARAMTLFASNNLKGGK